MFLASKIGFEYIEPGCVAQLVEQLTLNQRVRGSSPRASTTPPLPVRSRQPAPSPSDPNSVIVRDE